MEIKTNTNKKKIYNSPDLKHLGKIGEVTNTNGSGSNFGDGGSTLNSYTS